MLKGSLPCHSQAAAENRYRLADRVRQVRKAVFQRHVACLARHVFARRGWWQKAVTLSVPKEVMLRDAKAEMAMLPSYSEVACLKVLFLPLPERGR